MMRDVSFSNMICRSVLVVDQQSVKLVYHEYNITIYPCDFGGYHVICEDGKNMKAYHEIMSSSEIEVKFNLNIKKTIDEHSY
jgi:hypothetical protein